MQRKSNQEVVVNSTNNYRWLVVTFLSVSTLLCTFFYTFTRGQFVQIQYVAEPPFHYEEKAFPGNSSANVGDQLNGSTTKYDQCYITYEDADYPRGRRLGNHIYNVAVLIAIGRWNNMTPILPKTARILLSMNVPVKVVGAATYKNFVKHSKHFKEVNSRRFDPKTKNLTCNVTLVGYYQSWKYLEEINYLIMNRFVFKGKFVTKANRLFEGYMKDKHPYSVIGIHVRRGFMLNVLKKRGYVTPDPSYFQHAMDYFQKEVYPNKTLFYLISSDDIRWCKQNLKGDRIIYSTAGSAEEDMVLQSFCNDTITSLGSFGWWCGYFAQGHVTYFKDFAKPGSALAKEVNLNDMFYPHWTAIS